MIKVIWNSDARHGNNELLRAMMFETEATRRVLVKKGLLTNDEVLEEIKAVRREMEGKKGDSS
jgi:hypothetical protein